MKHKDKIFCLGLIILYSVTRLFGSSSGHMPIRIVQTTQEGSGLLLPDDQLYALEKTKNISKKSLNSVYRQEESNLVSAMPHAVEDQTSSQSSQSVEIGKHNDLSFSSLGNKKCIQLGARESNELDSDQRAYSPQRLERSPAEAQIFTESLCKQYSIPRSDSMKTYRSGESSYQRVDRDEKETQTEIGSKNQETQTVDMQSQDQKIKLVSKEKATCVC